MCRLVARALEYDWHHHEGYYLTVGLIYLKASTAPRSWSGRATRPTSTMTYIDRIEEPREEMFDITRR